MKRKPDPGQLSIFDVIRKINSHDKPSGSFDIDRELREAISASLKQCSLSRYQVVARMSELIGTDITKTMLDSWTAESKELHRFPAIFLPAFCEATGSTEPLKVLARTAGVFILPGSEALRSEIQHLEEEISRKRKEKQRRQAFLSEIEGGEL
ncbi:MAG: hypothetical protein JXA07_04010 [Spirochaetes bacterium]|nr:hypothetical protein [Spirochaetota bacterium]